MHVHPLKISKSIYDGGGGGGSGSGVCRTHTPLDMCAWRDVPAVGGRRDVCIALRGGGDNAQSVRTVWRTVYGGARRRHILDL